MIESLMAQCSVTDLDRAEAWYTTLFGAGPDARPMTGLIEWHPSASFGLQVYVEADRAGHSTLVLGVSDLEAEAQRLRAAGIAHDGPQPGGGARILLLTDPDGNRVVLTGE